MPVHLTRSLLEVKRNKSELAVVGVDCVINVPQGSSAYNFKCTLWMDSGLPTQLTLEMKYVFLVDESPTS